jgi:mRNA-degrading endonuclease RelE of RelBE toxin-antitoxin system
MPYRVVLEAQAIRDLSILPRWGQVLLYRNLAELAVSPMGGPPDLNIRQVKGHPGFWRIAAGPWRAFYRIDGTVVRVTRVIERSLAYRDLRRI